MIGAGMIEYVYAAMHDGGRELPNDRMGNLLGVFSDDAEAKIWLMGHGFSEQDAFGDLWRGRDRAWILETRIDSPTEDGTI